MNKYVLIPHDQYVRFKSFVVKNKDKTENVIENPDIMEFLVVYYLKRITDR